MYSKMITKSSYTKSKAKNLSLFDKRNHNVNQVQEAMIVQLTVIVVLIPQVQLKLKAFLVFHKSENVICFDRLVKSLLLHLGSCKFCSFTF